ncbi:MAG: magnesium transporter [Alphaproteobacteria bacterium]|nr:magnesium transporter [Alphaproteobacteria bacterium]
MTEEAAEIQDADDGPDVDYDLTQEFIDEVSAAIEANDGGRLRELVAPLHYSQTGDLVQELDTESRRRLIEIAGDVLDPEFLTELDEDTREQAIEALGKEEFAKALTALDSDDAVDLIEDLDEHEQREVLDAIPAEERAYVEDNLRYPEDSAGRMMQREVVAIPSYWTVGETIDYMRETDDLPNDFYDIFLVDKDEQPVGTLPLNRVLRTKRSVIVSEIMETEYLRPIPAELDQEEVAYLFRQLDLISAPVVDTTGRLVGTITIDDIVDVIDEEAEEDILRLGGVTGIDLYRAVLDTTRARFSWLFVNLLTAILASVVIAFFEGTIEQIVALAVLMPIVASMGGNAGTQTLTVAVRALAMRELTPLNQLGFIGKEFVVGMINGVLFAVLIAVVAGLWFDSVALGLVIALAMIINLIVAGVAGTMVPLALGRVGIDPAIASGVFVTTVTDVVGFLAFLGLAALILL